MIVLKKYQEEAVDDLLRNTYKLLSRSGARQPLIFKAPTGSGKTIMMAAFLNKLCEELPEKLELTRRKVAFVWIAPNKLYIQSYKALKSYFSELRSIKPIFFEDVTGNGIMPNEVLFVNWESINKEKNLMVRANEQGKTLYGYIDHAKMEDTEIIVIIDEEHMFASPKTAKRASEVLQKIQAKLEIRVSATPVTNADYRTTVERDDVVKAEMIKEGIILNPALDEYTQEGRTLSQMLIYIALEKRMHLLEAYKALGLNIHPLLLIQLPNDEKETNSVEDEKYIDQVIQHLDVYKGISTKNNKLAVWLSGRKENLDDIEKNDNMVEVLLFKQAIALGWDCPRAAVLLIFRELHSQTFSIQTVGRILRMPEQKHYPNTILNQGYVYTNVSRNQIEIIRDDMDYITLNKSTRIENYKMVNLQSTFMNTRLVRNRLGSTFRKTLYEVAEKIWDISRDLETEGVSSRNRQKLVARMINLDVSTIDIVIPENVYLTGELEIQRVDQNARFAKTPDELNLLFRQFCKSNVGYFAPVDSTPILEMGLKLLFEDYFELNEFDAVKIILYPNNQTQFVELIGKAIEEYELHLAEKAKVATKEIQNYTWEVPAERIYNEHFNEVPTEAHAMSPFYESDRVSNPEKAFRDFLEKNKAHLAWWYKNGENAKEHFAVPYTDYMGEQRLFYPDFVIQGTNNTLYLFDTKTEGSDPANAPLKHNALIQFIEQRNQKGMKTIGGIIIGRSNGEVTTWRYCSNPIENTKDLTGWDYFNLGVVNH
ncbi:MAG: DEAD/DEAH box helicase family protein [Bacteroidia bacterium]|nr:DEAD/DEAH box helicase family protein [Bacteroidia bacterium]